MATTNKTFSVKNGIDVANTVVIDSNRNLSNIANGYFSGNVGIGISTLLTNGRLQVANGIGLIGNTQIRQASNSDGNTFQVFATQVVVGPQNSTSYGYAGGGGIASVSSGDTAVLIDAGRVTSTDGRFKVLNTTSGNVALSLEKNGVYTLYANGGTGNVGIGTASPTSKFTVQDSLTTNNTSTLEINSTWNAAANTFTAVKVNITDTASVSGASLLDLQVGSSTRFKVDKGGFIPVGGVGVSNSAVRLSAGNGNSIYINRTGTTSYSELVTFYDASGTNAYININSEAQYRIGGDTILARDAANIFAQRNGTTAQTFRVYNTYTDASNYERAEFGWNANVLEIGSEALGSGVLRNINLTGGNVGIGTASPGYKLEVAGAFAAQTKSFVITHPTKPDMKLRYGSLEGPENGVYVRGRSKTGIIKLPEYWTGLVDESTITVNLTPVGAHQKLYVEEIVDNTVIIGGGWFDSLDFFYTVYGERKDVDKLIVEI